MARKRMIDPNFWISQDVGKLTDRARLLLIGMFSLADDYGKGNATLTYLRSQVFCYSDITLKQVEKLLLEIKNAINVDFYKVGVNEYYKFNNWSKWQYINRPTASGIPDPPESAGTITEQSQKKKGVISEDSVKTHGAISEDSRLKEKNIKEDNIIEYLNPLTPLKGGTGSVQKADAKPETKPDWNTTLLMIFQEEFEKSRGFPFAITTYKGKESKEINEVYRKYLQMKQSMGIVPKTDEALQDMRNFCRIAMNIKDKWIYDNMSPGVLSTKFATITTMMKENRNGTHQRSNLTDDDIAYVVRASGLE